MPTISGGQPRSGAATLSVREGGGCALAAPLLRAPSASAWLATRSGSVRFLAARAVSHAPNAMLAMTKKPIAPAAIHKLFGACFVRGATRASLAGVVGSAAGGCGDALS